MTADTSRLAIRSAVGHANIRSLLDDLFCGGVPTVSEALLGPVNEVLDRPEVAKFRRESASSSVRSIFKTMGINANDQGFGLFVQNERRLTDLDHVRSMIGCSARRCEAKPEILQLTDFAADMAKHAVVPGKPITKAQPGNIITIVGRNFSPVPSENKVRIGGNLAPVTYASPTTLTTIVGPLDISCKKNKLTLLSGNLEVSVETAAGMAKTTLHVERLTGRPSGAFTKLIDGMRDLCGHTAERSITASAYFDGLPKDGPEAAVRRLAGNLPLMLGDVSQSLTGLLKAVEMAAKHRPEVWALLDGLAHNSGLLEEMAEFEATVRDPKTSLLYGSGFTNYLCRWEYWVWRLVAVLALIIVVLAVIIVFLIIFSPESGGGTLVAAFLLTVVEALIVKWLFSWVAVAIVIEIVYRILRWLQSAVSYRGELPGTEPPHEMQPG